jgi:large subunit ribosomal protein L29
MKENADRARSLDPTELAKQLRDASEQMFRLRFQISMGQADGLKKYRSLRKERARMLTVVQERASGQAAPAQQKKAKAPAQTKAKPAEAKPAMHRPAPAAKATKAPSGAGKASVTKTAASRASVGKTGASKTGARKAGTTNVKKG